MNGSYSWKPATVGVLAGATLLLAVIALAALGARTGPLMWMRGIGLAESHDRQAFQIISAGRTPEALNKAAKEAGRAVELSPYNNAARLRVVYISTLQQRALKGPALSLFSESYDLMPYDHTVAAWRIRFGLEHWGELTPELRSAVQAEAVAFLRGRHGVDISVRRALESIQNPDGRLAATLWLQTLHF